MNKKMLICWMTSLIMAAPAFAETAKSVVEYQSEARYSDDEVINYGTATVVNEKITVTIPTGGTLTGTMPNASWTSSSGTTTITLNLMHQSAGYIDLRVQFSDGERLYRVYLNW